MTIHRNSLAAHQKLDKAKCRAQVFKYIRRRPSKGFTCAELAAAMHKPINEISGRCTELKGLGLVIECGNRVNPRSGRKCAVLRAK